MTAALQSGTFASLIAGTALFRSLMPDELADMAACTRRIVAARGEMLFRKDEPCTGLYLIVHGQVKLFFSSALGNEKILAVSRQGQTLGDSALFQEKNHQTYAQALDSCSLLHIAGEPILAALDNNRTFARQVIDSLSQQVVELVEEIESFSLQSGRERVIGYLLHEALRADPELDEHRRVPMVIKLPTSKGVIASSLNLTQEHFSRILHDLSVDGLLSVLGRNIRIENQAAFWRGTGDAEKPGNVHRLAPGSPAAPGQSDQRGSIWQEANGSMLQMA